jgi:hypothetical protein
VSNHSNAPQQVALAERMRRNSQWMEWACLAIMAALPVAQAMYWANVTSADLAVQGSLPGLAIQQPLQAWQRMAAGLTMAVPLLMMLAGVWQAKRCFSHFARGLVFTSQVARYLRNAAGWMAGAGVAAVVCGAAASTILTFTNAPGTRQLSIAFSSNHIFTLFFAALIWMMADVIAKGRDLVEENESFV